MAKKERLAKKELFAFGHLPLAKEERKKELLAFGFWPLAKEERTVGFWPLAKEELRKNFG